MEAVFEKIDPLAGYKDGINQPLLAEYRKRSAPEKLRPHWDELRHALNALPRRSALLDQGIEPLLTVRDGVVCIEAAVPLPPADRNNLERAIRLLAPWRKGPFSLFGIDIDAEWRSQLKWDRIEPSLPTLSGKRVCDVGCGNSYYLWRMLAENPGVLVGVDPSPRFAFCSELVQRFIETPRFTYEMFGVEQLDVFSEFFDVLLCAGVLYHQRNPFQMFASLRDALREDGVLLLETIIWSGRETVAFSPPRRYSKMGNVHFLPTIPCLKGWLTRGGFTDIELISVASTTTREQRQTAFAPFESLNHFLDETEDVTVEGYPAPIRAVIRATRR